MKTYKDTLEANYAQDAFFANNYLGEYKKKDSKRSSLDVFFIPEIETMIMPSGMELNGMGHNRIVVSKPAKVGGNSVTQEKMLHVQITNLNSLIDEKEKLLNKWLETYIKKGIENGQKIIDIMFELYEQGLVTISQVKNKAKINQYEFVKILAQKNMDFRYLPEEEMMNEEKIGYLLKLESKE